MIEIPVVVAASIVCVVSLATLIIVVASYLSLLARLTRVMSELSGMRFPINDSHEPISPETSSKTPTGTINAKTFAAMSAVCDAASRERHWNKKWWAAHESEDSTQREVNTLSDKRHKAIKEVEDAVVVLETLRNPGKS